MQKKVNVQLNSSKNINETNFAKLHYNVNKHLCPTADLNPTDCIDNQDLKLWGAPIDHLCLIRFPPGIAEVMRSRCENVNNDKLGLIITPSSNEDFRLFSIQVDIYTENEFEIISKWHPYIDYKKFSLKDVEKNILYRLELFGLLSELPTNMDVFKSPDKEILYKSGNLSQILIVFFEEDESISITSEILNKKEHDCVITSLGDRPLYQYDPKLSKTPKCPWLYPHGIIKSTHLFREEYSRDFNICSKSDIHATETAIFSILKRGKQQWAEMTVISKLEALMIEEALRPNSSVPNSSDIVSNENEFVVSVINSDIFNDENSELSDDLFQDPHIVDERELIEDRIYASNQKRTKDKKNRYDLQENMTKEQLESEFAVLNQYMEKSDYGIEKLTGENFYADVVLDDIMD